MPSSIGYRTVASATDTGRDGAIARAYCIPWLTAALLAAFIAVFALEQHLAVAPAGPGGIPATTTILALGGLSWVFVELGEGYRLLTAPFLHAGMSHLVGNAYVFLFAGYSLERLCGRAWMFCIFAAGGLAGSAMSLAVSAPTTVSVGASGAIMAMLAALFVISFRLPASGGKTRSQRWVALHVVPALIPFSAGAAAIHVDYGAHFGGFLFGIVLGFLLLNTWQEGATLPSLRSGAALLAVGAALSFGSAAYAVAQHYGPLRAASDFIPPTAYPRTDAAAAARARSLLVDYPQDPRSHLIAAQTKIQQNDWFGAEKELRHALALATPVTAVVFPSLDNMARALLARTLLRQGRAPEARQMAAAPCHADEAVALPPSLLRMLTDAQLCAGMLMTSGS